MRKSPPLRFLMLNWRDPENPLAGGAERVTGHHLRELAVRGHRVVWFANSFPGAAPKTEIEGIAVHRGGGPGTSIIHARKFYRAKGPFDLVIDQHHGIPWLAPWWTRANCLAYIHEVLGPIWHSFYRWPLGRFGRLQECWTHHLYRNTPFWTVSQSTHQQLQAHGVKSITVHPNGVDTEPLPELGKKSLQQPLKLVAVSRLAPNKRVDHAIRTLAILHDRGFEASLAIVGDGQEEKRLKTLAGKLGLRNSVAFKGRLPEAEKNRELYRAHLLLHTSIREGWGLNVLEANAMGTPAVVYPVGGLVDSTINGKTGLISERETPESLAVEIAKLARNTNIYNRLRQVAWTRSADFQWNRILPTTCDWLEAMAIGSYNK